MPRIAARLCLLGTVLFAVTVCAPPGTVAPATSPGAVGNWTSIQADVDSVTSGPGPEAVTVHVKALAGQDGCSRNVHIGYHEEESGTSPAIRRAPSRPATAPGW